MLVPAGERSAIGCRDVAPIIKLGRATLNRWAVHRTRTPNGLHDGVRALLRKTKHEPRVDASAVHRLWGRCRQRLAAPSTLRFPQRRDNQPCVILGQREAAHSFRGFRPDANGWLTFLPSPLLAVAHGERPPLPSTGQSAETLFAHAPLSFDPDARQLSNWSGCLVKQYAPNSKTLPAKKSRDCLFHRLRNC
jgi:hypothetical protein